MLNVHAQSLHTGWGNSQRGVACSDSYRLHDFRANWDNSSVVFNVNVWPFDSSSVCLREVFFSDKYIAPVHTVYSDATVATKHETRPNPCAKGFVIQLYSRRTLRPVNAISVPGMGIPRLGFIGHSVVIHQNLGKGSQLIVIWNQATGKVLTLRPHSPSVVSVMFCVSNSIVLVKGDGDNAMASMYKYDSETDRSPELIVDDVPLHMFYGCRESRPKVIKGNENLECFAILGTSTKYCYSTFAVQVRSKHDFSLRAEILENYPIFKFSRRFNFLLDDRLVFADDFHGQWLNVFALTGQFTQKVYAFWKPREMRGMSSTSSSREIAVLRDFVVLYRTDNHSAAVWKLPGNFVELCYWHAKQGTVGFGPLHCDRLITHDDNEREECRSADVKPNCYMKVDPNGMAVVHVYEKDSSRVMRVLKLDDISLDGQD